MVTTHLDARIPLSPPPTLPFSIHVLYGAHHVRFYKPTWWPAGLVFSHFPQLETAILPRRNPIVANSPDLSQSTIIQLTEKHCTKRPDKTGARQPGWARSPDASTLESAAALVERPSITPQFTHSVVHLRVLLPTQRGVQLVMGKYMLYSAF
jgi:hypothetical protein